MPSDAIITDLNTSMKLKTLFMLFIYSFIFLQKIESLDDLGLEHVHFCKNNYVIYCLLIVSLSDERICMIRQSFIMQDIRSQSTNQSLVLLDEVCTYKVLW